MRHWKERKAQMRAKSLPWMDVGIRKITNKRYKQLRKAQKSGNPDDWKRYKESSNSVNKALKRAEAHHWKKTLSEAKGGQKDFWKIVIQLAGQEKYSQRGKWPTERLQKHINS